MKKFYKTAEAGTAPGGYVVRLDGKVIKTPMLHPLLLSSQPLAQAVADEWSAQGDEVISDTMPMMQLCCTMVDKTKGADRAQMVETLVDYGASDLVCYFATHPQDLVARQELHWRPLLQWINDTHDVVLESVSGIQYHQQSDDDLQKLRAVISMLDPAAFTAVQAAAGAVGSVVIALALVQGRLTVEKAFQAACVDELYQLEKWGEDEVARKRLDRIFADLVAVERFYVLASTNA